ncbi:cytochrome c [Aeoliella sp. ICT_H6.2]|uniref:Cytochrome c n=1 Tax=Aeoliella straminimaris TaxID=2954799 RepID=A0A9X2FH10_9BACT|nr:cytochrome c [Aeoliella straminimaris]MCO6045501.1 cytochrome c [Aeoliella straminimaris]
MRSTCFYWLSGSMLLVLATAGCNNRAPQFAPNRMAMIEAQLVDEHQQQITQELTELFGTPDDPRVPEGVDLDVELLQMAAGQAGYEKDEYGHEYQQRGLYRQHCASCHGITGDGRGPAAAVLEPYPRDFRPGVFKWKSTRLASKPTDDDLLGVLQRGVSGTAMPSFGLLAPEQLDALVEYVRYLAIRGQVERELIATVADELDFDPAAGTTDEPFVPAEDEDDQAMVDDVVASIVQSWQSPTEQIVEPDPQTMPADERTDAQMAESIEAGRQLFLSPRAKCTDCHGADARSIVVKDYDDWNQAVFDFRQRSATLAAQIARDRENLPGLDSSLAKSARERLTSESRRLKQRGQVSEELLAPQLARPRELADGVFRGGDRSIDLFRRIHQGVAGTPMPGQGSPRPGVEGALSEQEIWQLVDYVRSFLHNSD